MNSTEQPADTGRQPGPIAVARRQIIPFTLIVLTGLILTAALVVFAPRKYRSEAKLLVKMGRENAALDPTVTTAGQPVTIHRTRQNEMDTAREVMRSRKLIEDVVDRIGADAILRGHLAPDNARDDTRAKDNSVVSRIKSLLPTIDPVPRREQAIVELSDALEIANAQDASVVTIQYHAKSPEMAHAVTDAWVKNYLDRHAEMNATAGAVQFFDRQAGRLEEDLAAARRRLQTLKDDAGVMTVAGAQATIESQLERSGQSLIDARARLAAARARIDSLRQSLAGVQSTVVIESDDRNTNEAGDRMRDRLYALEIEQRNLQSRLRPGHPTLVAMQEQVDEARRVLGDQPSDSRSVKSGVNPIYISLDQQLAAELANALAADAEIEAIEQSIQTLGESRQKLNHREAELAAAQREVTNLETQSAAQFEKQQQAELAAALQSSRVGNVNVVQPATIQRRPVTPNKKLCVVLGGIGTLLAALGVCTLREAARQPPMAPASSMSSMSPSAQSPVQQPVQTPVQQPVHVAPAGYPSPVGIADDSARIDIGGGMTPRPR